MRVTVARTRVRVLMESDGCPANSLVSITHKGGPPSNSAKAMLSMEESTTKSRKRVAPIANSPSDRPFAGAASQAVDGVDAHCTLPQICRTRVFAQPRLNARSRQEIADSESTR